MAPPMLHPQLKPSELTDIQQGASSLIIHGCVDYDNVGQIGPGETEFCYIAYYRKDYMSTCVPYIRMK
jgi:hypothetical protein